jgi:PHD/YefM family antitoxin component YafN of YafNO toxin-antitoxin module
MVRLDSIRSLTDFQRNAKEHLKRLKETGEPEVLTINGQAELVVQSAESYQKLLDSADLADSVHVLGKRLESVARGEKGVSLKRFDASMRKKYSIERRPPRRS